MSLWSATVFAIVWTRVWRRYSRDVVSFFVSPSCIRTGLSLGAWAMDIVVLSKAISRSRLEFPTLPIEVGVVASSHTGRDCTGFSWIKRRRVRHLHWRCDERWL
jgi:hypothetical protein